MLPLRDTIVSHQVPVATWGLIGINAGVFFLQLSLPANVVEQMFHVLGIVPFRYTHPQTWALLTGWAGWTPWPLLTSQFLHGGWFHILANMWTLWIFGDNVEDRLGSVRFVVFYLLCGVLAGVLHIMMNPTSTLPTIGASGAISGVLGAYVALFPGSRIIAMFPVLFYPLFFELPALLYVSLWFIGQLFSGALSLSGPEHAGGVAWWAHIGGFLAGLVMLPLFLFSRRTPSRHRRDYGWIEQAWIP